jgi:ABC-type Fe3+-citrate transport system substrate-binding protein
MPTKFKREELKSMTINPHFLEKIYEEQLVLASHRKELAKWEAIVRNMDRDIKISLMRADDLGIREELSEERGKLVLKVEYKEQGGKQVRSRLWVAKG